MANREIDKREISKEPKGKVKVVIANLKPLEAKLLEGLPGKGKKVFETNLLRRDIMDRRD